MAAELELENQSRDTVSPPQFHTHSNGETPCRRRNYTRTTMAGHRVAAATPHAQQWRDTNDPFTCALHISLIRRMTASFRF